MRGSVITDTPYPSCILRTRIYERLYWYVYSAEPYPLGHFRQTSLLGAQYRNAGVCRRQRALLSCLVTHILDSVTFIATLTSCSRTWKSVLLAEILAV
jgi:hypothetical protein